MPLEFAELAAGLPFATSLAMAGGISAIREGRRRSSLNEAMHELRRPLQAIAFLAHDSTDRREVLESSLHLAAAAVQRLDCEINGGSAPGPVEALPMRWIVESAVERWQVRASLEGRVVNLKWEMGDPGGIGDPIGLAQVLDNLISNGLTHGSGEVAVVARRVGGVIRLVVASRWSTGQAGLRRDRGALLRRLSGRRRHGHGLRVVRRAVARNSGRFHLRRRGDRCEAVLELPLSEGLR
jgi:signal transduction histidine kinase